MSLLRLYHPALDHTLGIGIFTTRIAIFWRYRHAALSGSQTIDPNQWPADQRGLFEWFIDHSRRLHMCRLSLMVAAVGLVLAAGSASAAHRSGFWGSRYCLQGQNLRLSGPLPILDFPVVPSERLGNPILLRDQSPICGLCAPAVAARTTSLLNRKLPTGARHA